MIYPRFLKIDTAQPQYLLISSLIIDVFFWLCALLHFGCGKVRLGVSGRFWLEMLVKYLQYLSPNYGVVHYNQSYIFFPNKKLIGNVKFTCFNQHGAYDFVSWSRFVQCFLGALLHVHLQSKAPARYSSDSAQDVAVLFMSLSLLMTCR